MDRVWREFKDRVAEVESHFSLIEALENGSNRIVDSEKNLVSYSTTTRTMQRATSYLLLYNLVESTMSKSLIEIHLRLSQSGLTYEQFNREIKLLILNYYGSISEKKTNNAEASPYIYEFAEFFSGREEFLLEYDVMAKHYALYSGNLDSKKIKETLRKYGVYFDIGEKTLQAIKDNRNKLAHGEISFEECGRDVTIQEIVNAKNKCIAYLERMIIEIEIFLHNREFERH